MSDEIRRLQDDIATIRRRRLREALADPELAYAAHRLANYVEALLPPAGSPHVAALVEQAERVCQWLAGLEANARTVNDDEGLPLARRCVEAQSVVGQLEAALKAAPPVEPEPCAHCGHRTPHRASTGDIADACEVEGCDCA